MADNLHQPQEADKNPFDAPDMVQSEEPGLVDRARLNMVDSFYRGTIVGSAGMFARKKLADDPAIDPATREKARKDYESVLNDLGRYETMRDFAGPLEMSAAFAGQMAGGSLSPEAWVAKVPGAGRLFGPLIEKPIGRFGEQALTQAAVQGATDPAVQALSIGAGTQKEYSPLRTVAAVGLGAGIGAALHIPHELAAPSIKSAEPPIAADPAEITKSLAKENAQAKAGDIVSSAEDKSLEGVANEKTAETAETPAAAQAAESVPQESGFAGVTEQPSIPGVGELAPKIFAPTVTEPQDIRGFVRAAGGLKDWKGELKAADINKRFPGLVSNNGTPLDRMREAAMEAGFLSEDSTPDDLVQALLSDEPVYSMRDRDQAMEYKAQKQAHEHAAAIKEARQELSALEANPLYPEIHDEAARLMVHDGMSADDALAHAAETIGPTLEPGRAPAYRALETEGLQFKKRTATGESIPKTPVGTTAASAAEPPNNQQLLSLQEQSARLAEEIGHPLRQGRVQGGKEAEGQFDVKQGVVRVKNIADFETIAHEAGHYIDAKLGPEFAKLKNQFDLELGLMDYDPARNDPAEGFAEFARQFITAPQAAERAAPGFTKAFEAYLAERAPTMLESLLAARQAYAAWEAAPSGARLDAMVKSEKPDGVISRLRKDGFAATVSNVLRRSYEALFDDKAPITRAVRDLARMARDASGARLSLEGTGNPEVVARLFSRAHQAAVRSMMDGIRPYHHVKPEGPSLRDALIKATGTPGLLGQWDQSKLKQFSNYLTAKRVSYLWDKKNAGLLDNRPAAMTKGDADLAIAELDKDNASFAEAAQMVHDYTRQLLRKMFDGGLIERELYDTLSKEAFYVPLYRDMSDKPLSSGAGSSGGAKTEGPGITQLVKRMRGSDRDILDPVQSIMTQTFLIERTLAHNDMLKSFVDLARAAQQAGAIDTGRVIEEVPPKQLVGSKFDLAENVKTAARKAGVDKADTQVLLGALTDIFGDDPIMGQTFHLEPTSKRGEPIVFYKEGGQLRAVRLISDKEGMALYEALTTMPPAMRDWAVTLGAASATMLRSGVINSPQFAIANFVRDQLATSVLRADYLPFWDGLRGVGRELKQGETAQLYTSAGGMAPGSGASGLSDMVNGDIDQLARKGWVVQRIGELSDIRKGNLLAPMKALGDMIGIAESGTRLAVFEKVFEQKKELGLSDYEAMIEAAFQATDLMDFSRHGSGTELVRKLVPFLNANLQGLDKARRTILAPLYRAAVGDLVTEQEAREVKNAGLALFKMAGVGGALGYAYGLWAQRHQSYQDANDRLRATHLVVPGSAFGKPEKILVVPKPFELAIGFNLGETIAAATTGDPRAMQFALDSVYEVLAPPNVLDSIPIVKNWAELKLNRSFYTGREIVPAEMQKLVPEEQYNARTSALAKIIGKKIGVSPMKVDYAIGQQFSSLGRDVMSMSNAFDPDAPVSAMEDSVFARRFIKSAFNGSEADKRYWELAGKTTGAYAQAKASYENMLAGFRDKDAAQFLAGLPEGERLFVQLNSDVGEDGKPIHSSDARALHPLTRAAKAVDLINAYSRSLMNNTQFAYATGERTEMSPDKRRSALDALNTLKAMEQQNALILSNEPGYAGRKLQDTAREFEILKFIAPETADEIASRYASSKIAPMATIERIWPEMRRRLLSDGHKADLSDLVTDAKADGYAFGGERVKKPGKRRVPMGATAAQ